MKAIEIFVTEEGDLQFVVQDGTESLFTEGAATVRRASHVEPHKRGGKILWCADMEPVGGPAMLGFTTRAGALQAETEYLSREMNQYTLCLSETH